MGRKSMSRETLELLDKLRKLVLTEQPGFGIDWSQQLDAALPRDESQVNEFIDKRTRYYRQTQMLPLIDQAIKILKERGR